MKTTTLLLLALAPAALAAPPGNGGVVPPASPEDVLYEANLLANPGFEKGGFEKDRTKGWGILLENGMEAKIESAAPNKPVQPFEGRKALRCIVARHIEHLVFQKVGDPGGCFLPFAIQEEAPVTSAVFHGEERHRMPDALPAHGSLGRLASATLRRLRRQ